MIVYRKVIYIIIIFTVLLSLLIKDNKSQDSEVGNIEQDRQQNSPGME